MADNSPAVGKKIDKKICRVCGDKASAINFNVLTCESCKAFFRRNALTPQTYRCTVAGNCSITVENRKRCKSCRLQKCFKVGMMKEMIMTDDERTRKKQLIEENRARRVSTMRTADQSRMAEVNPEADGISSSTTLIPSRPESEEYVSVPKIVLAKLIFKAHKRKADGLLGISSENCTAGCPYCCGENQKVDNHTSFDQAVKSARKMKDRDDLLCALVEDANAATPVGQMNIGLSATKLTHLDALKSAFRVLYDRWGFDLDNHKVPRKSGVEGGYSAPMLPTGDIIARVDDIVRRMVIFCSRVPALGCLPSIDQGHLIKAAIEELVMLRGFHAYMPEQDGWRHTDPLGPVTPLAMLKYVKGNVYGQWKKALHQFPVGYVQDEHIFLCILMMVLFKPDSVRVIREFYLNTLLHYLIFTHGHEEGGKMWQDIKERIANLKQTSSVIAPSLILELDSNDMKPLLIEALGL